MRFDDPLEVAASPAAVGPEGDELDELLGRLEEDGHVDPSERQSLTVAHGSYRAAMDDEFGRAHDHFGLVGQENLRRYQPVACLRLRVHPEAPAFYVLANLLAASVAGVRLVLSVPPGGRPSLVDAIAESSPHLDMSIDEESDDALRGRISSASGERMRFASAARVPTAILEACAREGVYLVTPPPLAAGRLELLNWFQEQSLCLDTHRYGNLGRRAHRPPA